MTVMTASWGAGRLATLCLLRGRGARGTIPTVWRRGLPRAAVIGRARRPAADVQPGVSPADDDRDVLAHAVEVGVQTTGYCRGSGGRSRYSPRLPERRRARGVKTVWPGPPHVQPSRSGEPSPLPGLSREGMAADPGHKLPCNSWPSTGGSPDMRWLLRHPPARYPGSRGIWVHRMAATGPPHARTAVRPPDRRHARSVALGLGNPP